jgi:hypothetical protein
MLNALLWFGHDERVCLGIEFSGPELNREVQVWEVKSTVRKIIERILRSSEEYELSVSDGVVLIRRKGTRPPAWLDHRLPKFDSPKMELMRAGTGLWMRLELDMDPSIRGFGGDGPVTDPPDEVGPFHERGRTVGQLLVRIVASSRGAAWFPTTKGVRVSFPASVNRFWTLVTYSAPNAVRPK